MPYIITLFSLLALTFLLLALLSNIIPKWPRLPGDIYFEKPGIRIYIPVASAIVISVLLSILFNFFGK